MRKFIFVFFKEFFLQDGIFIYYFIIIYKFDLHKNKKALGSGRYNKKIKSIYIRTGVTYHAGSDLFRNWHAINL